jgi:hypothetical protein
VSDDEIPTEAPVVSKKKASLTGNGLSSTNKKRVLSKPVPPKPITSSTGIYLTFIYLFITLSAKYLTDTLFFAYLIHEILSFILT